MSYEAYNTALDHLPKPWAKRWLRMNGYWRDIQERPRRKKRELPITLKRQAD